MRRAMMITMAMVGVVILLTWPNIFLGSDRDNTAWAQVPITSIQQTGAPSQRIQATSLKSSSGNPNGLDPAIIAALIAAVGVVIGALISGGFVIYQIRRNTRLMSAPITTPTAAI